VNDSAEDAGALIDYLRGVPCKVNLLNYNPGPDSASGEEFSPVSLDDLLRFRSLISRGGLPVLYRRSLGVTIGAGCGQLGRSMSAESP
jgi:23S rRNA (adenine2503-C2)-methyltransferase